MAGVRIEVRGSTANLEAFLNRAKQRTHLVGLEQYGPVGVAALARATPVDTGKTAEGWYYEIVERPGYYAIHWLNSHIEDPGRIPVAAIIQYGHATGDGGWIEGIDYINPALAPIFDQIIADMWKEVTK